MCTKWACGECGCRWDSEFEAERCCEKERKERRMVAAKYTAVQDKNDYCLVLKDISEEVLNRFKALAVGAGVEFELWSAPAEYELKRHVITPNLFPSEGVWEEIEEAGYNEGGDW